MIKLYQGSDKDLVFTLTNDNGTAIDLTNMPVAVRFVYAATGEFLTEGYSTGAGFPNNVTVSDAANGEITVNFNRVHTNVAEAGVLDMHVVIDKGGAVGPANHCKIVVNSALEITYHALPNVSAF